MNKREFLAKLGERIRTSPVLGEFSRRGEDTWSRQVGDAFQVIWFQKHTSRNECCVGLGVHFDFIPLEAGPEGPSIAMPQMKCGIRWRLTEKTKTDQWWAFSDESIDQIARLLVTPGLPAFAQRTSKLIARAVAPKDIKDRPLPPAVADLTKTRASLLLARIHEARGDLPAAKDFAEVGLELTGAVVGAGLRKHFTDIIERCRK